MMFLFLTSSHLIPTNRMDGSSAALLLFSFFLLFAYPHLIAADNEGDRLLELIKSRRPPGSVSETRSGIYDTKGEHAAQVYVARQDGLREADKIDALPGQPRGVKFEQYGGYVTVDHKAGRALFYYFAEAPEASKKPLVLWLNGGPGCSSLGGGGFREVGPFLVSSDNKTLYENKYSWNKLANMIFLESPAGVGYSYSNTTSDYKHSGDKRTAEDNYAFLLNWLERFPQYKGRDFFITGESYAGHYIPQLANLIISRNKIVNATTINLKGVAIGNPYIEDDNNRKGTYDFFAGHSMISQEVHEAITKECRFNSSRSESSDTHACDVATTEAHDQIGKIDRYNIYAPLCTYSSFPSVSDSKKIVGDPCSDLYVSSYLNLADVQRALHANTTGLKYEWSVCSGLLGWNDSPQTLLPEIKKLIASGPSVWLYSGDVDSVVPVRSTEYSLEALRLQVETPWKPWFLKNEVGGYVVGYKGLVFATVRGAGHMVPRYQPERALALFSAFLRGKTDPSDSHKSVN